jgi:hypothetical protein
MDVTNDSGNTAQAQVGQTQQAADNTATPQKAPIDLIISAGFAAKVDEDDISLDTLKQTEIDKIMQSYKKCRDEANKYYDDTIEPKLEEREDTYTATEEYYMKRFPSLSEKSKFCSRDIKTTVDTLLPSFMEVFCGGEDPVDVKGVNTEDDDKAAKIQALLKYQIQRKNAYATFLDADLRDALILNYGIAKVYWEHKEKRERYKMLLSQDNMDVITMLYQEAQQGEIEIVSAEPLKDAPDLRELIFDRITVTSNHPVISYMPPSELRFTPDSADLQSCKFKAHRKLVVGDYLKRKENEGVYKNVDKALEDYNAGDTTVKDFNIRHSQDLENIDNRIKDSDNASKKVELYEAYMQVDYNNDGVYEDIIVHAVGSHPISISKNKMGIAPFFINQAEKSSYSVFNEKTGLCDNLIQQQDLKTAIFRQCIINVAKNNMPRIFLNANKVNMDDMINDSEIVQVHDDVNPSDAIFIPPQLPFNNMAETILQYSQNEIESQSGSTKYNQGLDSNSLNKTATGITAIMGASEKRTKNTARLMAEEFILPIMKYMILLDQEYLKDGEMIRLTDKNINISKDELNIDYDLIINVGDGAGTREARINYLMVLIQQIIPVLEQRGLVDTSTWFETAKDLFEQMGIRNVTNYIVDPSSAKGQALKQQQAQQAQQQTQQQLQLLQAKADLELKKAMAPRLTAQYDDLPVDAQQQVLKAAGINPNADLLVQKEALLRGKEAKTAKVQPKVKNTKSK